jgi:hypothetical protein
MTNISEQLGFRVVQTSSGYLIEFVTRDEEDKVIVTTCRPTCHQTYALWKLAVAQEDRIASLKK